MVASGSNKDAIEGDYVGTDRMKVAIVYSAGSDIFGVACALNDNPVCRRVKATTETTSQTAILGCALNADGERTFYWNGTVYGCEIYYRALVSDEVFAKLGVQHAENIVWNSSSKVDTNGAVASGKNYVSDFIELPEGTTDVYFSNFDTGAYTWLGIWEYDENQNFISGGENSSSYDYALTLQANTKYVRVSAFPANSDCNDPDNQLVLLY